MLFPEERERLLKEACISPSRPEKDVGIRQPGPALPVKSNQILNAAALPQIPAVETAAGSATTEKSAAPGLSLRALRWAQNQYDPATWEKRSGPLAKAARLFFKIFPEERSAWVIASGISFSTRLVLSETWPAVFKAAANHVPQQLSLMSFAGYFSALYFIGVPVNWLANYTLLRWQDRRAHTRADGTLDEQAFKDSRSKRLAFLPSQELTFAAALGANFFSWYFALNGSPSILGWKVATVSLVGAVVLQYFGVKLAAKAADALTRNGRPDRK